MLKLLAGASTVVGPVLYHVRCTAPRGVCGAPGRLCTQCAVLVSLAAGRPRPGSHIPFLNLPGVESSSAVNPHRSFFRKSPLFPQSLQAE